MKRYPTELQNYLVSSWEHDDVQATFHGTYWFYTEEQEILRDVMQWYDLSIQEWINWPEGTVDYE
jgi:hypothetical protein